MKSKPIIAAAIMLLAMSGAVFAQELKFDGYLNSGLGIVSNDSGAAPYYKAFGVDGESNGYRFRLNGSYTNEAKNAGARFRLQSQRRADQGGLLSLPSAFGWVGFFENKLTVTGGIVLDGTWETVDWYWIDDQGEGLGLLLKSEPIKGLSLGFGAYTISQQSGGSNNILSVTNSNNLTSLPNFRDIIISPKDAKYTFNAAYTMADTFRLGASYRMKNRAGWLPPNVASPTGDYPYGGREELSQFIGEFRLLAVKGLTAVAIGIVEDLEDFNSNGNVLLSETFAYKINDDLNIGLNAAEFFYRRGDAKLDPGLLFNLLGSYAIGNVVPRIDFAYFLGGRSKTVLDAKQWERRGFEAQGGMPGQRGSAYKAGVSDADDDYSVFSVRPSVKFNLDSRTFLEIGDMINFDFANHPHNATNSNPYGSKKSLLTNVFYADVKFTF